MQYLYVYIEDINTNFKVTRNVKRKKNFFFSSYLRELPGMENDATGRVSFARAINFYVSDFFPLPNETRNNARKNYRFPEFYARS